MKTMRNTLAAYVSRSSKSYRLGIMAGVDQIIQLDGQIGTVIDTILLIVRAVMAVLYS